MRLMRMLGVAVVWAGGVALVASISWVAINSAGRQVVDTSVVTTRADGSPMAGVGTSPATAPTTAGPSPHAGSQTVPTTPTGTRTRPGATGVPTTSGTRGPDAPPTQQSAPKPPPSPPGPGPLSDTKSTASGVVWLECTGPRVTSLWAQPSDGWSADPRQRGAGQLDIYFTRPGVTTLEVVGTCPDGQPHFEVRSHKGVVRDSSHSDGDEDDDN